MPANTKQNTDLILNQVDGSVKWRAYIRSPGLSDKQYRLGDLRLECEMQWAMEVDEMPFVMRNLFRLGGGICHISSSNFAYSVKAPKPIKAATLVSGDKKQQLSINRQSFLLPIHDKSWNDESTIEFEFES